jgi:hypothetical protein
LKLSFSAAALAVLGNQPKMRIRTADMSDYLELQIRPTDRGSAVNMPKSEQLVDVTDEAIEIDDTHGGALVDAQELFVVQSRKHGWYALTAVRPAGSNPPVVNRS